MNIDYIFKYGYNAELSQYCQRQMKKHFNNKFVVLIFGFSIGLGRGSS